MENEGHHYEILEIKNDAKLEEIKQAYRKLALHSHPDKNPGNASATKLFQNINEAYEALPMLVNALFMIRTY